MTAFAAHPTYSAFEAANRPFADRLDAVLARVTADDGLHARFLNTLSMLEHMGSRRIMITQAGTELDQETLKHMAEEARHAFFFKRQANRFSGTDLDYADTNLIAPAAARFYFKRLEAAIKREIATLPKAGLLTYLYMSVIVEFRAVWGFTLMQAALDGAGIQLSLKSLLAEEQGHLDDMEAAIRDADSQAAERTRRFLETERALFARFLASLETALAQEARAA
jgi:hypothetical protein